LAVGAEWIFRPVQGLISPVLCSCDVLLLLLTGLVLELMWLVVLSSFIWMWIIFWLVCRVFLVLWKKLC